MKNNLIECKYGNHLIDISNFTPSGLNGPYKICRACKNEKQKAYMKKHNKEYNNRVREYNRIYKANQRAQKKENKLNENNIVYVN